MDVAQIIDAYRPLIIGFGPIALGVMGWFFTLNSRQFQRRMAGESFRRQGDTASLSWGNEVIHAMSEAQSIAQTGPSEPAFDQRRREALWRLSSLVDRGRLFFPNLDEKGDQKRYGKRRRLFGEDVEETGNRPPIIDTIMYAYYELRECHDPAGPTPANSANYIFECRRQFVAALQAYLDPHRYDDLVDRFAEQNKSFKQDLMEKSGELGITLDCRRGGLMSACEGKDFGWSSMIGPDRRRELLRAAQDEDGAACPPIDAGAAPEAAE